ncbi:CPBP family intramembrane glutamic endopeptidase [Flavobacterium sp. ZS1P70]|uniref:CPBP family intramembrane glutamic endopeptidase n=1 Tax=Flavobacterium zhoui TaxID=3230414 RepID=A0ABW6I6F3_9FLAO
MWNTIKENYTDLMGFIRNPTDQSAPELTLTEKSKKLLSLLIIEVPLMGILITLISALETMGLVNSEDHKLNDVIMTWPIWSVLLFTVVIGPFIEELIFRSYLRYKKNYLFNFIISLVSLSGFRNEQKIETFLTSFWKKRYKFIFYFSAILFGVIHINNFKFSYTILLLSPILVAPQIVLGLFIGFLRVRYGFILGFLLHVIHNAIFIGITLIFMINTPGHRNIKETTYSNKIEEIKT